MPIPQRVLRSIYGNEPYADGWAEYAEFMLQDAGCTAPTAFRRS
jgi:uncharacterized protein (DUF885 family)